MSLGSQLADVPEDRAGDCRERALPVQLERRFVEVRAQLVEDVDAEGSAFAFVLELDGVGQLLARDDVARRTVLGVRVVRGADGCRNQPQRSTFITAVLPPVEIPLARRRTVEARATPSVIGITSCRRISRSAQRLFPFLRAPG